MVNRADLSRVDVSKYPHAIEVVRIPQPFSIVKDGAFFNCYQIMNGHVKTDGVVRLPSALLKSQFTKWPNFENIVYKIPSPSYAVIINRPFLIQNTNFETPRTDLGEANDYLITRESGMNEICKYSDFNIKFILKTNIHSMKSPLNEHPSDTHQLGL
jgi:hypothetical protein